MATKEVYLTGVTGLISRDLAKRFPAVRAGVIVAIIDTGIDYTHPDLRDSMWVNPHEIPGNGIDDDGNGIVDEPSRLA